MSASVSIVCPRRDKTLLFTQVPACAIPFLVNDDSAIVSHTRVPSLDVCTPVFDHTRGFALAAIEHYRCMLVEVRASSLTQLTVVCLSL